MNNNETEFKEVEKLQQDLYFVLFVGTAVMGTLGNLLIIWIIVAHKSMRTKLNGFVVNIALSDLIVSLCSIPLGGYQRVYKIWIFGSVACTIQESIETIGLCVFILSLTMIAMERHYAIIPPAKRNDLELNVKAMTTLELWITSLILSAPSWIFATVYPSSPLSTEPPRCIQVWPDAETGNSLQEMYNVFFIFLTYLLPLIYMIHHFGRLYINLWVTKNWQTSSENRQSVKMMITVVLTYAITSLPLRFCNVFDELCYARFMSHTNVHTVVFWLALSNTSFNPFVLCCMDRKFRLGFKKAIRWLPLVNYNPDNILEIDTGTPTC